MRILTLLNFLMLFCVSTMAQNVELILKKSNYLHRIGEKEKSFDLLTQLANHYSPTEHPEQAVKILSEQADWYYYHMVYDTAKVFAEQALKLAEASNFKKILPRLQYQNGVITLRNFEFDLCLKYFEATKASAKEQNMSDLFAGAEAKIKDAFEIYYFGNNKTYNAHNVLPYLENAINAFKASKDTANLIPLTMRYLDIHRSRGNFDIAASIMDELEGVFTTYKNQRFQASFHNYKSIYYFHFQDTINGMLHLEKALSLSKKAKLNPLTQHFYIRYYELYKSEKQYQKALAIVDTLVPLASTHFLPYSGHDLYFEIYKETGDFGKAIDHMEKWRTAFLEEARVDKLKNITEWETKFKTQEKEVLLNAQKSQRNWLILFIGLIASFSFFLFLAYRSKKKINQQLIQKNQLIEKQTKELRQLDQMKSRFFANVSHELRTPLTMMMAPLNTMIASQSLNNRNFTLASLIKQNTQHLHKLVNEILDLTKLDAKKMELKEEKVSLYFLSQRIIANYESYAQSREIELTISYDFDQYLQIRLDAKKFEQVFNNLVSNAFKYTSQNGQVHVKVSDLGHSIQLKVSDTGRGIHSEDLPNIFNRFYQSNRPDVPTDGGTGIGLSLCMELANLMKGKLWVESELGQGSQFFFEFPKFEILGFADTSDANHKLIFSEHSLPVQKTPIQENKPANINESQILVVEDNPSLRSYLSLILSDHFQVQTANHGLDAINILNASDPYLPDLIISDIMMPEMDGYQLIENLKTNEQFRKIPIIMLTARTEMKDKLKALRIGVDDYMLKPFEEIELLARVKNLLQHALKRHTVLESSLATELVAPETNENSDQLSDGQRIELENIETLVLEYLGDFDFSVVDLARLLSTNRWQLNNKIKQLTGLTTNQYIQEVRLNYARTLLEKGEVRSVKSLVYTIGLRDGKYFSKKFKERFGKNPSAYL